MQRACDKFSFLLVSSELMITASFWPRLSEALLEINKSSNFLSFSGIMSVFQKSEAQ